MSRDEGVRMKIICPESKCRLENDALAEVCERCQTPLQAYVQLLVHPARLFNKGLAMARENQYAQARDLFAAIVHWCPMDMEARNALAMACFVLNDLDQAHFHWERILAQSPADTLAKQGLAAIQQKTSLPPISTGKQQKERRTTPAQAIPSRIQAGIGKLKGGPKKQTLVKDTGAKGKQ